MSCLPVYGGQGSRRDAVLAVLLCDAPNGNDLHHYCIECYTAADLIPHRETVTDVCTYLLTDSSQDSILLQHPH